MIFYFYFRAFLFFLFFWIFGFLDFLFFSFFVFFPLRSLLSRLSFHFPPIYQFILLPLLSPHLPSLLPSPLSLLLFKNRPHPASFPPKHSSHSSYSSYLNHSFTPTLPFFLTSSVNPHSHRSALSIYNTPPTFCSPSRFKDSPSFFLALFLQRPRVSLDSSCPRPPSPCSSFVRVTTSE